jgi:DNA repair exonuclease SbcCD ATPase subunit
MKEKNNLSSEILQLKNKKTNFETNKKQIEESILSINTKILSIKDKILYINRESNILDSHILAIDKMSSLVKRDFRGFLLTHIIDFINVKAKEYCSYVFETDEIEFELNGNSIDILYCGKDYENLSGGEKQKVDLIIQFSIRDMLSNYLNFSSNILVLDEITDNLDSKGSDKVVSLISNKLTDVESVFIITHHTELLRGLFEREISVEKDENGVSKIKQ